MGLPSFFFGGLSYPLVHFFVKSSPKSPLYVYLCCKSRVFNSHVDYIDAFLAEPSLIGVADNYGIELLHPRREGRSPKQIGKKGLLVR